MTSPLYRYSLVRDFGFSIGEVPRTRLYVMLNPSTAEADMRGKDDPTIRRLIYFTKRDGFHRLIVENLCPLRATDPEDLRDSHEAGIDAIMRAENNQALRDSACVADQIVVAWGANAATYPFRERATEVASLLRMFAQKLWCFGITGSGHPRHPLYLKNNTPVVEYHGPSGEPAPR